MKHEKLGQIVQSHVSLTVTLDDFKEDGFSLFLKGIFVTDGTLKTNRVFLPYY